LWHKLYIGTSYYGRRGVAIHCISAIDNCLWSIRAQAAGVSLGELLGGRKCDIVVAYASTLFRETPEACSRVLQQLTRQLNAAGDFAQAYVIAHEVGHHVQNLVGVMKETQAMREQMSEVEWNSVSVQIELQADCFAGIWGHFTAQKGILEQGDLEEALNAAQQIGDDTLQKRTQGYVVPESFNHGTSQQRVTWFKRGFDSGKLSACDTFNNPV
jgi:hypothetical protein